MLLDLTVGLSRSMEYRVCILSAGRGMRLGPLTDDINKSLLPIDGRAIISHIIEKFPRDVEIVVAVGYQADKVCEYLSHAHDDRKIVCVEVPDWDAPGAGPGASLLRCKGHLPGSFVIYAADTLLMEHVPPPDRNWLGVAPVTETERFCTVQIKGELISKLTDKRKCDNRLAFVGVAGIRDYEEFWEALEADDTLIENEKQLSNGLATMILHRLHPEEFTWFDTGTIESFEATRKHFEGDDNFVFDKVNEFTYQINGLLVKYFGDPNVVKNRLARAEKLEDLCPTIRKSSQRFYSYEMVKGKTVYECLTPKLTSDFITWAMNNLWIEVEGINKDAYNKSCDKFYRTKTLERVAMFYKKYPELRELPANVNGEPLPPLSSVFEDVNWSGLSFGLPTNFHGDLQFDNVLRSGWLSTGRDAFKLIDWRQDFDGRTDVGDMRYDLAKLYGGLTIPYNLIKQNKFKYDESADGVTYDIDTTLTLNESQVVLRKYINDLFGAVIMQDVETIRALIFLNMAPLHAYPFDKLLYYMGWSYLHRAVHRDDL